MSAPESIARPKVLVVDDEVFITRMTKKIMSRTYDVTCANSLAEGLAAIEKEAFDAALVDDRMPDGRGPELLLRLGDRWPRCLRFLVTANLGIAKELDADFFKRVVFAPKPLDMRLMMTQLAAALASRGPPSQTEAQAAGAGTGTGTGQMSGGPPGPARA